MHSSTRRAHALRMVRKLWCDQRGLGAIELIVVLVLIVALSVAFWNLFGNDVACRFSEAITSFDDAKRPAGQCMDSAAHGSGNAAGGASARGGASPRGGAGGRGGKAGTSSSGRSSAGATPRASGTGNTVGSHTSAAPLAVPSDNAAPQQALPPSAPQPSAPSSPSPPSPPSPPAEPSIGDRIESGLATVGRHAVDFSEGVIAGANPLAPVMPVELKPTFGNQVTFGTGQIVGSLAGLAQDAGNMLAGGTGMLASGGVLVLSNGTLVFVAVPGFGASTALAAVGVAGAAGHGTNFMQGIDNVANGENAPSKPSESSQGGSSTPEKPPAKTEPPKSEPPPATEKPASNAAEHQRYLEQLREEAGHVDLVDAKARNHILNGDTGASGHRGGGHQYPGEAGKSAFPRKWSSDRIIHEVSDVATDPASVRVPGQNRNTVVKGTRDGIDITVIVTPGGRIVTGFPTNVPRNP